MKLELYDKIIGAVRATDEKQVDLVRRILEKHKFSIKNSAP
jgi:hypothetical protein